MHTLLLAGVIVGIFFSSAITVLISILDFDRLGGVVHWLLGNLGPDRARQPRRLRGADRWSGSGWSWARRARSTCSRSARKARQQLGVDAERLKRRVFAGAALLTSRGGGLRRARSASSG